MPAGPVVMPGTALSRFRAPMFRQAERLRGLGRHGDTILAHINPAEAMALHAVTDGMTYNPYTGLPEFYVGEADAPSSSGTDTGNPDSAVGTISTDEQATNDAIAGGLNDATVQGIAEEAGGIGNITGQAIGIAGPQGIFGGPASRFNPPPEQVPFAVLGGPIGMGMQQGLSSIAQAIGGGIAAVTGATNEGAVAGQGVVGAGGPTGDNNGGGPDSAPGITAGPSFAEMPIPSPAAAIPAGPPLDFPAAAQRTRRQPYDPLTYAFGPQKAFYDYSTPMARGGLARAARRVAGAGRHGDTRLMHMAPEEVGALSRMGRLTRNPQTGLPEAFSLKKAFKVIAPVGGALLGNYLGGPLGSAIGGAAGSIVGGAKPQNAILNAALAYGLGKIGQLEALGGTGLSSLSDDWDRLTSGALGGGTALDNLWGSDAPPAPLPKPADPYDMAEPGLAGRGGAATGIAGQGGMLSAGKSSDLMKYAPLGLLALSAMSPQQQQQAVAQAAAPQGNTGMAAEGLGVTFPGARKRKLRSLTDFDSLTAALDPTQAFYEYEHEGEGPIVYAARGGLARYARGRMVRGPGDGVQDAIPARLSDGEYVVPSAAVSALGNGSTEAGGRRLDKMVSSTMRQRFGSPNRIPPRVRAPGLSAVR